jgi:hypothetical protein
VNDRSGQLWTPSTLRAGDESSLLCQFTTHKRTPLLDLYPLMFVVEIFGQLLELLTQPIDTTDADKLSRSNAVGTMTPYVSPR